jgi:predicted kinase
MAGLVPAISFCERLHVTRMASSGHAPMLIVFAGLPGVGKTRIARALAPQIDALHLRIDSIEQAILAGAPPGREMDDAGYRVARAIAADNLRLGHTVIADAVNPIAAARTAWRALAQGIPVAAFEVEVICSNAAERRRRVERRTSDIPGLRLPTWDEIEAEVRSGGYEPWDRDRLVVDTFGRSVDDNVDAIRAALARHRPCGP